MAQPRTLLTFLSLSCAFVCLAACAGPREPAKKMMDDIKSAVSAASADAAKYAPGRLNDVQIKLDDLQTAFDAQDFRGVLVRGPALLSEAQGLAGAAAAKKADTTKALTDEWNSLADTVPDELTAVHHRIDALGRPENRQLARHSDKRIDLEAAKSGIDAATSQWSKAQGAFGNGNLDEAVAAGNDAKTKVRAVAGAVQVDLL